MTGVGGFCLFLCSISRARPLVLSLNSVYRGPSPQLLYIDLYKVHMSLFVPDSLWGLVILAAAASMYRRDLNQAKQFHSDRDW